MNLFEDINANTIYYQFGQSWAQLTGTDAIITFFCGRREYTDLCSSKTKRAFAKEKEKKEQEVNSYFDQFRGEFSPTYIKSSELKARTRG